MRSAQPRPEEKSGGRDAEGTARWCFILIRLGDKPVRKRREAALPLVKFTVTMQNASTGTKGKMVVADTLVFLLSHFEYTMYFGTTI
jgi:hypothetical protein